VAGGVSADHDALRAALAPDGHRLLAAPGGTAIDVAVRQLRPSLVFLVGGPDQPDPLRSAAELRRSLGAKDLPIVAVVGEDEPARAAELLAEATDVVTRPWSAPMLRSRVRAWLARSDRRRAPRARRAGGPTQDGAAPRRVPDLFAGLPARERAALLRDATTCRYEPGDVLCREGEAPGGVYYLREGAVQVWTRAPNGQEVLLAVLEPGTMAGELAALDAGPRTATVVAVAPTVVDYVPRDSFIKALEASPRACLRLLKLLATRLRATDRRVGDLTFGDLPSRVARYLLQTASQPADESFTLVSLAAQVGVEQPRLERALMLLEAGGLVRAEHGAVRVADLDGLLRFALE
jgi:CRP/FNR family transcriptional regulator